MRTKKKLKTPLIKPEPSLVSKSIGGVANIPTASIDDSSQRRTYQSFDTFIDNEKFNRLPRTKSEFPNTDITTHTQSIIFNMLITFMLFILGSSFIVLSILAHQNTIDYMMHINSSYMILSICIGSCFLLCAAWKLLTACYCNSNTPMATIYVFGIVSCILSFILSIFAFLYYYNISFTNNISYPFWLNIALISYSAFIIFTGMILKMLPPNHFKHFKISSAHEAPVLHKNAPEYIRKYSALHPYDRSTIKEIWHSFTHQWLWNIINLGARKPLEIWDCYNVPQTDHILSQCKVWDNYLKQVNFDDDNYKFSTFKCVWQLEGRSFITRCLIYMSALVTSLAVPFLISALSEFYENKSTPLTVGLYLSLGLWFVAFIRIEILSVIFTMTGRCFARTRALLIYVVYRKAIRLSLSSSTNDTKSTIGQKITMMGSDTRMIAWAFAALHFVIANLVLVIIICLLLFYEIGYAAFIGWAFFILFTGPIQGWIGEKVHKASKKYIESSDVRVKFIGELIRGIQVTKMYCWETALLDKVFQYRRKEMEQLLIRIRYSAILSMMNISTPHVMILLMLGVYIGLGNELTLSTVFAVITLVQLLRIAIRVIPFGIMIFVGAIVSLKRLNEFFSNKEQTDMVERINTLNHKNSKHLNEMELKTIVFMKNATFVWNELQVASEANTDYEIKIETGQEFKLNKISLKLQHGKIYALVGLVGSGKSSLLQAILGEMMMTEGCFKLNIDEEQCIGYVSQKAFIINCTVRENILFGLEYDEQRYLKCIAAAALNDDLLILVNGDLTEIGERGINLSGGQKARISFARSLYRKEMINLYLLDDPLSAVDVHVGKIMFHEGILNLLADKTRVIVMNSHLDLLQYMDEIIILDEGHIAYKGTFEQVMKNEKYLHLLPKPDKNKNDDEKQQNEKKIKKLNKNEMSDSKINLKNYEDEEKGLLTTKEDRGIGNIKWSVYSRYFSNSANMFNHKDMQLVQSSKEDKKSKTSVAGILLIVLELGLLILAQTFSSGSDIWLSFWAEEDERNRFNKQEELWWIMIWSIIIGCLTITSLFGSYLFGYLSLRAAQSVHMKTLYFVLRAPMSYFNATPTGRILNRFSKDTNEMDDELINNFNRFSQDFLMVVGYIVVIIISNFYTLFMLILILPILYWIQKKYRPSSRDLKRMTQITLTPIITQFNETLVGLDTIRAYKLNKYFLDKIIFKTNENHKVFLTEQLALRWFSIGMDLVVAVFIFIVALMAALLRDQFPTALLSLSVVYGYGLMGMLQWAISASVEVEKNFTAIERLLYFEDIESEADTINFNHRPPNKQWPNKGKICINNLKMKYRKELDFVLRGININVSESEKIGIVGRTGAGKSSLFKALFRMIEPEGGSEICIDNFDILKLGLNDLRNRLAIIPQDAVLFSGSVRFNLDPFNEYNDDGIWDILKKCELYEFVQNKNDKLEYLVGENGSNFSHGQKQLICIGRALLKKSKILFLDEATSSIDKYTDKLIQKLIRKQFKNTTVLCIAHRLQTIIDYDKIMVLDNGKIVEYDTPENLLNKNRNDKTAIFKNMMKNETSK